MIKLRTSNSYTEKFASTLYFPGTHETRICTVRVKLIISMEIIRLVKKFKSENDNSIFKK